jgi:hypothetical protein
MKKEKLDKEELYKYKFCDCPKEDWEVIVVDYDENFNEESTIYHHCVNCDDDFIIENYYTGKFYYINPSIRDKMYKSRKNLIAKK